MINNSWDFFLEFYSLKWSSRCYWAQIRINSNNSRFLRFSSARFPRVIVFFSSIYGLKQLPHSKTLTFSSEKSVLKRSRLLQSKVVLFNICITCQF